MKMLINLTFIAISILLSCNKPKDIVVNDFNEELLSASFGGYKEIYNYSLRLDSVSLSATDIEYFNSFDPVKEVRLRSKMAYWKFSDLSVGCSTFTYSDTIVFRAFATFDSNMSMIDKFDKTYEMKLNGNLSGFSGEHLIVQSYNSGELTTIYSLAPFTVLKLDSLLEIADSSVVLRMKYGFSEINE
jgi:hypothetical protein